MDIDLFLFGEAFQRTWKLQKGTVIVLLNPDVFKKKDGKGFNLRMTQNKSVNNKRLKRTDGDDEDDGEVGGEGVLEVGFAKDWAGCEALRTDGTLCGDWVDTRHTTVCAYHIDQGLKRARKGRMEYAVGYKHPLPRSPPKKTSSYLFRMRAFSPKKEKEQRNPFAPKKVNNKEKPPKTREVDKWDGGGGTVYHNTRSSSKPPTATADDPRKRTEGIKRTLRGNEREREIRRSLHAFAPPRPVKQDENQEVEEEVGKAEKLLEESRAFDAKRVRAIGFDPRRRANEDVPVRVDRKVNPIVGGKISLEGVLGGGTGGTGEGDVDSDSDSDLDIIMAGG
jgi:Primase zinc finger